MPRRRNADAAAATPAASRRKVRYAPITLSELDGVRYLHFGTEWVQGAMRLRKPDWLELEYAQQMMAWLLFIEQPQRLLQLGLGSAALTKFCYRQCPQTQITVIELNPAVIAVCASMFKLPPNDERLSVLEADALDFVLEPAHHRRFDVLQLDLYDATARGPVLDTPEFYRACAACLSMDGCLTVNLFGDHPSFMRNLKALRGAFAQVLCLPEIHDGNVVAIALKQPRALDFTALYQRADAIHAATALPARSWVDGLQTAQAGR